MCRAAARFLGKDGAGRLGAHPRACQCRWPGPRLNSKMFDLASRDLRQQRVAGRAAVALGVGARLERLAQAGSAKAMMPRMHGRAPEVVFLNTAGGLTGGDRLDYAVTL